MDFTFLAKIPPAILVFIFGTTLSAGAAWYDLKSDVRSAVQSADSRYQELKKHEDDDEKTNAQTRQGQREIWNKIESTHKETHDDLQEIRSLLMKKEAAAIKNSNLNFDSRNPDKR